MFMWRRWRLHATFGFVQAGYMLVNIYGIQFRVHHLCCWTFHGAPLEKRATADHRYHCTRDNRASQLRWATPSDQRTNQRPQRTQLDTWPVEAKVAEDSDWAWYPSARACAEATGEAMRLWLGHILGDVCEEDGIIHSLNIHAGTCFGEVGILPYFRAGTMMDGCIFEVGV